MRLPLIGLGNLDLRQVRLGASGFGAINPILATESTIKLTAPESIEVAPYSSGSSTFDPIKPSGSGTSYTSTYTKPQLTLVPTKDVVSTTTTTTTTTTKPPPTKYEIEEPAPAPAPTYTPPPTLTVVPPPPTTTTTITSPKEPYQAPPIVAPPTSGDDQDLDNETAPSASSPNALPPSPTYTPSPSPLLPSYPQTDARRPTPTPVVVEPVEPVEDVLPVPMVPPSKGAMILAWLRTNRQAMWWIALALAAVGGGVYVLTRDKKRNR